MRKGSYQDFTACAKTPIAWANAVLEVLLTASGCGGGSPISTGVIGGGILVGYPCILANVDESGASPDNGLVRKMWTAESLQDCWERDRIAGGASTCDGKWYYADRKHATSRTRTRKAGNEAA